VFANADWEYATSIAHFDFDAPENAFALLRHGDKHLLFSDGEEIIPGITAMFTPGHTPGSVSYVLDQGGERWVFTGDSAKNRGEIKSGEVQMTVDAEGSKRSIKRIREVANRVLPGHDGWITIRDGEVIPEGGNDVTFIFGEGVTVNGGLQTLTISMDR
jgi:glyoxylase-like metal-dependent hydrolase (beta-lactamase superfamily II)